MGFQTIEGVHYIFDRYAYLGLSDNAGIDEIKRALKERRTSVHPDRLIKADDTLLKQADHIRSLIDDCERILLNDELRPIYTERLKEFRAKNPQLVSENGVAILDMSQAYLSLDTLLTGELEDTSALEEKLKQQTGFDESKFQELKAVYGSMKDNQAIRNLYKEALQNKYVYLSVLETVVWGRVGYVNKKESISGFLENASDYADKVEEEISRVGEQEISALIAERNDSLRIGVGKMPLLLTDSEFNQKASNPQNDTTALKVLSESDITRLEKKARQTFDLGADYIREIARQKQETLEELVTFTEFDVLKQPQSKDSEVSFYVAVKRADGEYLVYMKLDYNPQEVRLDANEMFEPQNDLRDFKMTIDALDDDSGHVLVYMNPEISQPLVEIGYLIETHYIDTEPDETLQIRRDDKPTTPKL